LIEKIEEELRKAKERFKELKTIGNKIREREVLDYHSSELLNSTNKEKTERKKIIK